MRKHLPAILLIAVFLVGLSLLLYPTLSNAVNLRNQSRAIASYEDEVEDLAEEDFSGILLAAETYNQALLSDSARFLITDEKQDEYLGLLDPTGTGIMGYLEIGSIGVELPIYHGTGEKVLQVGAGHMAGSSLPVGGESTHCVLSGHRGLPSAELLSDLDKMETGDIFYLHVLDEVLAYEVDQIRIVDPDDTADLQIVEGKDYCTLVTCTPYGINTQRLLVRGVRIPYDESVQQVIQVVADASEIDPMLVAPSIAVPVLLILLAVLLIKTRGPKSTRKKEGGRH